MAFFAKSAPVSDLSVQVFQALLHELQFTAFSRDRELPVLNVLFSVFGEWIRKLFVRRPSVGPGLLLLGHSLTSKAAAQFPLSCDAYAFETLRRSFVRRFECTVCSVQTTSDHSLS